MSPIQLLNEKEAAHQLGLSTKTLQAWRWHRKGPAYRKLGRRVFYTLEDLHAFVDSRRIECSEV